MVKKELINKNDNSLAYFEGKVVLIISPDRWGKIKLSKHHYAMELAKRCKRVFFLNPPQNNIPTAFHIEKETGINNLHIVNYKPWFNHKIRFHIRQVFDFLMKTQIRYILKCIGEKIDVVWCFEPNLYTNLLHFKAPVKIFHPVDEIEYSYQKEVARNADIVFSLSNDTILKLDKMDTPIHFINHGVSNHFLSDSLLSKIGNNGGQSGSISVGYVGNLLLSSLDRGAVIDLIYSHPEVSFHFWGPLKLAGSNLSGDNSSQLNDWIYKLESAENVCLHGVLNTEELAIAINKMDVFLIALDNTKDKNKGANSHKILEYLSTGKVVVSKPIGEYLNKPDLIEMSRGNSGKDLLEVFAKVVGNLEFYNSIEMQQLRKEFAKDHSYCAQLDRIAHKLVGLNK